MGLSGTTVLRPQLRLLQGSPCHSLTLGGVWGWIWAPNWPKVGGAAPGFEPRTSCMRVRSASHYATFLEFLSIFSRNHALSFPNSNTTIFLNDIVSSELQASPRGESRFLSSPVYPKYYVGGRRCRWKLRAEPGQRIQLRLLDVSLRSGGTHRYVLDF